LRVTFVDLAGVEALERLNRVGVEIRLMAWEEVNPEELAISLVVFHSFTHL
jgi:hypothetical protein